VLFTDELGAWWDGLSEAEQDAVDRVVRLLMRYGVTLSYPYSSSVSGSDISRMRELRIQHAGEPYRVLYAFDAKRRAVLLIGGVNTGDERWYEVHVPKADRIWREYLRER